jgi:hypothetical protein
MRILSSLLIVGVTLAGATQARELRLITAETRISAAADVNARLATGAYDPTNNQFMVLYQSDANTLVFRRIDADTAQPLSAPQTLATDGAKSAQVVYDAFRKRFIVSRLKSAPATPCQELPNSAVEVIALGLTGTVQQRVTVTAPEECLLNSSATLAIMPQRIAVAWTKATLVDRNGCNAFVCNPILETEIFARLLDASLLSPISAAFQVSNKMQAQRRNAFNPRGVFLPQPGTLSFFWQEENDLMMVRQCLDTGCGLPVTSLQDELHPALRFGLTTNTAKSKIYVHYFGKALPGEFGPAKLARLGETGSLELSRTIASNTSQTGVSIFTIPSSPAALQSGCDATAFVRREQDVSQIVSARTEITGCNLREEVEPIAGLVSDAAQFDLSAYTASVVAGKESRALVLVSNPRNSTASLCPSCGVYGTVVEFKTVLAADFE